MQGKNNLLNFQKIENYAKIKSTYSCLKNLLMGALAGIFISLGYVACLKISTKGGIDGENGVTAFLSSSIFCVGIMMCIFLNGNLFTSNCMIWCPFTHKQVKGSKLINNLFLTFVGNFFGAAMMALIIWGIGIFGPMDVGNKTNPAWDLYSNVGLHKIELEWWKTLLSAIFCNVIVCSSIIVYLICDNKAASMFVIYLMITLFAISGYQHVVANMFVGSLVCMIGAQAGVLTSDIVAQFFWQCLLFSMIGNFIGGAIFTSVYYKLTNERSFKKTRYEIKQLDDFVPLNEEEIKNKSKLHFWQLPKDLRKKYKLDKNKKYDMQHKKILIELCNQDIKVLNEKKMNLQKKIKQTKDKQWTIKANNKINKIENKIKNKKIRLDKKLKN